MWLVPGLVCPQWATGGCWHIALPSQATAGTLLAPGGFAAFLRARWSCLLHVILHLWGLCGAPSLQTGTRVLDVVRGPCGLEGNERDKAGAEVVGSHLFG